MQSRFTGHPAHDAPLLLTMLQGLVLFNWNPGSNSEDGDVITRPSVYVREGLADWIDSNRG